MLAAKAAVGVELYLAKAGVLSSDNIIAYIKKLAEQRAERHGSLRKMEENERSKFLDVLARYVFRDYSSVRQAWLPVVAATVLNLLMLRFSRIRLLIQMVSHQNG
jgi:hypothetical protein